MNAFGLVATEKQVSQLTAAWSLISKELLFSTEPVDADRVDSMLKDPKCALRIGRASVLAPICGRSAWPTTEAAVTYGLVAPPQDLLTLRRRTFLLVAMTGCLTYVLDEQMGNDFEVALTLSAARIAGFPTVGVVPAGNALHNVPSAILSLTDVTVSGEADPVILGAVLRSLGTEPTG